MLLCFPPPCKQGRDRTAKTPPRAVPPRSISLRPADSVAGARRLIVGLGWCCALRALGPSLAVIPPAFFARRSEVKPKPKALCFFFRSVRLELKGWATGCLHWALPGGWPID